MNSRSMLSSRALAGASLLVLAITLGGCGGAASEATARHLASETEGEDPAAISGPVETIAVVATGVRILAAGE